MLVKGVVDEFSWYLIFAHVSDISQPVAHFVLKIKWRPLQWRHFERDGVSNHQPHDCLFNYFFRRKLMKTSKLRVTGRITGPLRGEFTGDRWIPRTKGQ